MVIYEKIVLKRRSDQVKNKGRRKQGLMMTMVIREEKLEEYERTTSR